jgi:hypothetical protein
MIGQTISYYPALRRDSRKRNKILEKLGEGRMGVLYKVQNFPTSVFQRVVENLRIPTFSVGTQGSAI